MMQPQTKDVEYGGTESNNSDIDSEDQYLLKKIGLFKKLLIKLEKVVKRLYEHFYDSRGILVALLSGN